MIQVMRRIPAILVAGMIALAAVFAIGTVTAHEVYALSGDGSEAQPYEISSYEDLKAFAAIVNGTDGATAAPGAYAELKKDIFCSDQLWVPIGDARGHQYTGCFNGDNHKIIGLSNAGAGAQSEYQGLFGYIGAEGTVSGIGIEESNIQGKGITGGVVGWNYGRVTGCHFTGNIGGSDTGSGFGGVAGANEGEINNCYHAGSISGGTSVGGVAGDNKNIVTKCYHTGSVRGGTDVGGVVGRNDFAPTTGTITYCYNIGSVSGGTNVGGVVGNVHKGTATYCYSAGAISGGETVGGLFGRVHDGTASYCYYDQTLSLVTAAEGAGGTMSNVSGYATSQMTGNHALADMMRFDGSQVPWLVKNNGKGEGDVYYFYYPHLKGLDLSYGGQTQPERIAPEDWPAKAIVSVDGRDSFTYDGNAVQAVNKVTVSTGSVSVPEGATDIKYSKWNGSGWGEPGAEEPADPGVYKLSYTVGADSDTIVFRILEPETDYSVEYRMKTGAQITEAVDAGDYKALITLGSDFGSVKMEKEFTIKKAPLTIIAKMQRYVYNGQIQGPGDEVYEGAAEVAGMVTVSGLQPGDELTSIEVDGQGGPEIGLYPGALVPCGAGINSGNGNDNYDIEYLNGDIVIDPIPLHVTLKGSSTKKPYTGKQQTYKGKVTVTSSDPTFDVSKFHYKGSTTVKGTNAGTYTTKLEAKKCVYDDPHYELKCKIGAPIKLTITQSDVLIAKMTAKSSKSLTISWTKVSGAEGYDIFFIKCGKQAPKKVKTIKGNKTFKWTKSGLMKGKAYKAVVKAYVMKNGKKTYVRTSPMVHAYTSGGTKNYTNSKSVTVKKTSVLLKAGKTYKIKAGVTKLQKGKKLMPTGHAPILRYISGNKKIATVSKSGKIKAKSKGSCKVYVIAVNGARKAVHVTVK